MTDDKLKAALAKMPPDIIEIGDCDRLEWIDDRICQKTVIDTELFHLCALVENAAISATWQQRATALAKVKGIEV